MMENTLDDTVANIVVTTMKYHEVHKRAKLRVTQLQLTYCTGVQLEVVRGMQNTAEYCKTKHKVITYALVNKDKKELTPTVTQSLVQSFITHNTIKNTTSKCHNSVQVNK